MSAAAGVLVMFASESTRIFAPSFLLLGLLSCLSFYVSLFHNLSVQERKGRGSGFNEGILGSGVLFGPALGGCVGSRYGLKAPYAMCFAVLMIAVAGEALLVRQRKGWREWL